MDEKQLLEEYAVQYFIEEINKAEGCSYKVVAHLDKPDFIVEDTMNKAKLGVEITHLFYDQDEAKMLLGRPHSIIHGIMDIGHLIERLNLLLWQKAEKAKDYILAENLFLLVRVASSVFTKEDFDQSEDKIMVPESSYRQIWLLFRNASDLGWGDLKRIK